MFGPTRSQGRVASCKTLELPMLLRCAVFRGIWVSASLVCCQFCRYSCCLLMGGEWALCGHCFMDRWLCTNMHDPESVSGSIGSCALPSPDAAGGRGDIGGTLGRGGRSGCCHFCGDNKFRPARIWKCKGQRRLGTCIREKRREDWGTLDRTNSHQTWCSRG